MSPIFYQTFKNYEKYFLFHLKSSFPSQDIQFFKVSSLLFHTFLIQKGGICPFWNFEITQKPLILYHQTWSDNL